MKRIAISILPLIMVVFLRVSPSMLISSELRDILRQGAFFAHLLIDNYPGIEEKQRETIAPVGIPTGSVETVVIAMAIPELENMDLEMETTLCAARHLKAENLRKTIERAHRVLEKQKRIMRLHGIHTPVEL